MIKYVANLIDTLRHASGRHPREVHFALNEIFVTMQANTPPAVWAAALCVLNGPDKVIGTMATLEGWSEHPKLDDVWVHDETRDHVGYNAEVNMLSTWSGDGVRHSFKF